MNFGMAAEKAKQEGIEVKMVVIADDCALDKDKGITGGRGLAGTVFVHKTAGATAAGGGSLNEVFDVAVATANNIQTLGVALSPCHLPGTTTTSNRLSTPGSIEVGMGIHGESGRYETTLPDGASADFVAKILVENILKYSKDMSSFPFVLMINNLGALPTIEVMVILKDMPIATH